MLSLTSRRSYLGLLAIVLGYAVLSNGGLAQPNWYVCLLILAIISAAYWLRMWDAGLVPPREPWLGWACFLLPPHAAGHPIPLPASFLRIISPARSELLDRLAHVGEPAHFAPISITPEVTSAYLLRIVAYTLVFLLVRELSWQSRKLHSFAPVFPLIAIAAVEAALGLVQSSSGADAGEGTYGNKYHFAGLLEMALPLTIAVGLALITGPRSRSSSRGPGPLAGGAVLLLAALIILGLVASVSKMGYV